MGARGPTPTPTAKLKARGSWRAKAREKAGEPEPPPGEVVRPAWMSPDAAAIWDEFAPALIEMGVLTTVDVDAFADWCKLRVLLRNQGGMMDPKVYTQLVESSARQGALFGLNPSARTRIKADKPKEAKTDDGIAKFFPPKLAKA